MEDAYALSMFQALRRLQQGSEVHAKRLSRFGGLTPLQLLILQVMLVEREITASRLAKRVSLSQASLSGVLDRLESRGLLARRRDEQDRRKQWLLLEDAGRDALQSAKKGEVPDLRKPFDDAGARSNDNVRHARDSLITTLESALTRGFRSSFALAALFALLALVPALRLRRRPA